jgi:4-carboxymuconolactone decarboxylase
LHARPALSEGESREEVRYVGLLALTTIGFPHTVAGLSWIEEVIEAAK